MVFVVVVLFENRINSSFIPIIQAQVMYRRGPEGENLDMIPTNIIAQNRHTPLYK